MRETRPGRGAGSEGRLTTAEISVKVPLQVRRNLATSDQKRVTSNPSLFLEVLEIGFPFHGEEVILFAVTFFTNGGHVSLGCLASPNQGNDVIHG
jgi:hypothetical protein